MKSRWIAVVAGFLLAVACLAAGVIFFSLQQPGTRVYQPVTPAITLIAAPSLQPTIQPTATLPQEMLATLASLPPDPGASIGVGMNVHIAGTGGDGLRVRESPGVDATPLFLAAENEEFIIIEGPQSVNNLNWWYIKAPYDDQRQGWAAANYLSP